MAHLDSIDPAERDPILKGVAITQRIDGLACERLTQVQFALQSADAGRGDARRRSKRSLTEDAILDACFVHAANQTTQPSLTLAYQTRDDQYADVANVPSVNTGLPRSSDRN